MRDTITIDCKDHLLGRLCSTVAKELLNGNKVNLVHCEKICVAGSMYRIKHAYLDYFQKRTNFNHKKGPFHFRAPSHIVAKTVRRMLPIQTARGRDAYSRLHCYDGLPEEHTRNMLVIPSCIRDIKLKPQTSEIGWKHFEDNKYFEEKAVAAIAERKAANLEKYNAACQNEEIKKLDQELQKYGYGY